MKPCPFCGHAVDLDDPDTLYPNGTGWRINRLGYKTYVDFKDVPQEQWCYNIHCVTTSGGCDASISGDSKQECIDKWNRRV
jgi:hypothetical protein